MALAAFFALYSACGLCCCCCCCAAVSALADPPSRKFGKQIQKRQLEVPEYAANFVNYKALKKVCLASRASPTTAPSPLWANVRFEIERVPQGFSTTIRRGVFRNWRSHVSHDPRFRATRKGGLHTYH